MAASNEYDERAQPRATPLPRQHTAVRLEGLTDTINVGIYTEACILNGSDNGCYDLPKDRYRS